MSTNSTQAHQVAHKLLVGTVSGNEELDTQHKMSRGVVGEGEKF